VCLWSSCVGLGSIKRGNVIIYTCLQPYKRNICIQQDKEEQKKIRRRVEVEQKEAYNGVGHELLL